MFGMDKRTEAAEMLANLERMIKKLCGKSLDEYEIDISRKESAISKKMNFVSDFFNDILSSALKKNT